jgi:1-acyl-sn-glycerol-3-phosphate acyltransferase
MALIGTHELLPIHTSEFHPVPVTLVVGEPMETRGFTMKQVDVVTAELEERIAALYYEHSWRKRPAIAAEPERNHEGGDLAELTVSHDLANDRNEGAPQP